MLLVVTVNKGKVEVGSLGKAEGRKSILEQFPSSETWFFWWWEMVL